MSGYKGHKVGSRKESAHKLFDESGPDAALQWGIDHGLADTTVRSWCKSWGQGVTIKTPRVKVERTVRTNVKLIWSARPIALVAEGPQQSVIKFLDTGTTQAVASDEIVAVIQRERLRHEPSTEQGPDRVSLARVVQRVRLTRS